MTFASLSLLSRLSTSTARRFVHAAVAPLGLLALPSLLAPLLGCGGEPFAPLRPTDDQAVGQGGFSGQGGRAGQGGAGQGGSSGQSGSGAQGGTDSPGAGAAGSAPQV